MKKVYDSTPRSFNMDVCIIYVYICIYEYMAILIYKLHTYSSVEYIFIYKREAYIHMRCHEKPNLPTCKGTVQKKRCRCLKRKPFVSTGKGRSLQGDCKYASNMHALTIAVVWGTHTESQAHGYSL